jgi:hypothetical protein
MERYKEWFVACYIHSSPTLFLPTLFSRRIVKLFVVWMLWIEKQASRQTKASHYGSLQQSFGIQSLIVKKQHPTYIITTPIILHSFLSPHFSLKSQQIPPWATTSPWPCPSPTSATTTSTNCPSTPCSPTSSQPTTHCTPTTPSSAAAVARPA